MDEKTFGLDGIGRRLRLPKLSASGFTNVRSSFKPSSIACGSVLDHCPIRADLPRYLCRRRSRKKQKNVRQKNMARPARAIFLPDIFLLFLVLDPLIAVWPGSGTTSFSIGSGVSFPA
jgi:hypothetical protein